MVRSRLAIVGWNRLGLCLLPRQMSKVCHLSFIRGVPSDEDQAEDLLMQCHRLGKSSRREFLRGAAAIALTGRGFMSLGRPVLAYVGTYSSPQGPEGAIARGQGIYLFEMNAATGALRQRDVFPSDSNPSWRPLNPSRTHLYSTYEIYNYKDTNSGYC